MRKIILTILCCLIAVWSHAQEASSAMVIMQLSDPQMGFQSNNRDMVYETQTLTKAIEAINRLQPDVVVFTGDCVHNSKDKAQWQEFKRITAQIAPSIRTLYLPGNHDTPRKNGSVDLSIFSHYLGKDHFSVHLGGMLLTGINSNYMKEETNTLMREKRQFQWLSRALKKKKPGEISIVFAHHPFFLKQIDEPDGYSTLPVFFRQKYFDLFKHTGVQALFAGHLHDNAEATADHIEMVTTSAVGRQLGSAQSGLRIIILQDGVLRHRYYSLDALPQSRADL